MLIKVKVFPSASRDEVIPRGPNAFEIFVRAAPRAGAATRSATVFLAAHLGVPVNTVRLRKGACERHKIFEIKGG